MKKVAILGSTGSVGKSTLRVMEALQEEMVVSALAAKQNDTLLSEQIEKFSPRQVFIWEESKAQKLQKKYPHLSVYSKEEGLHQIIASPDVDIIVFAMSSSYSLSAFLLALKLGKRVALANKELLVMGGELIKDFRKKNQILPLDSEHSALFQCLQGEDVKKVRRVIVTASGGPFYHKTLDELRKVTVEEALRHPTWTMGSKITVDSSTLMNKGLEVIEAHYLFDLPPEKIEVVIHPQSFVHSMVEFEDGSILAQMSNPDMCLPIQYALTYPERKEGITSYWDCTKKMQLDFYPVDKKKFPCLELAYEALKRGNGAACYLNACNEVLVEGFLEKKISWIEISQKLQELMSFQPSLNVVTLEGILKLEEEARQKARFFA